MVVLELLSRLITLKKVVFCHGISCLSTRGESLRPLFECPTFGYILKIFIPLQKWGTIFLCTIFDVQYSCGQYLKHLRFALFWVLQICLQYCFWYPHIFSNLFHMDNIWNFFSKIFFPNFFIKPGISSIFFIPVKSL